VLSNQPHPFGVDDEQCHDEQWKGKLLTCVINTWKESVEEDRQWYTWA
jgi:hypothetical protein